MHGQNHINHMLMLIQIVTFTCVLQACYWGHPRIWQYKNLTREI